MSNTIIPANDNRPLKPRDWYSVQAVLVVPDEPPKVVAIAFYLGQSRSWLGCLPPHHAARVYRRKYGRRFLKLA